jgi:hypothetical protein
MRKLLLLILFLTAFFVPTLSNKAFSEGVYLVASSEKVVYITDTGNKYHKDSFRYLLKSKIKTTVQKAIQNSYDACKVCKP